VPGGARAGIHRLRSRCQFGHAGLNSRHQSRRPFRSRRCAPIQKWAQRVLTALEKRLDGRGYIACEDFSVADILMTLVLWEIRKTDLLDGFPNVKTYFRRCQDRPAWERTRRAYEERLQVPRGTVQ
jgi:glutathione S-transferase